MSDTPVEYVPLAVGTTTRWAGLRELCGHDEQLVAAADTRTAIRLLGRLLVAEPGLAYGPGDAFRLTASERDRLLAAVYLRAYGPRVTGSPRCAACDAAFDLDFTLPDLLEEIGAPPVLVVEAEADGVFRVPDGGRFRLPTGADEVATWGLPPDQAEAALLAACVVGGDPRTDGELLQAAMAAAGPLLSLELDARCPECGHGQLIPFDMQSYLLTALAQERQRLAQELHLLALTYGWGLHELLGLPRGQRRRFMALAQRGRDAGPWPALAP